MQGSRITWHRTAGLPSRPFICFLNVNDSPELYTGQSLLCLLQLQLAGIESWWRTICSMLLHKLHFVELTKCTALVSSWRNDDGWLRTASSLPGNDVCYYSLHLFTNVFSYLTLRHCLSCLTYSSTLLCIYIYIYIYIHT